MNLNTEQLNLRIDFENLYEITEGKKSLLLNLLQVLAKNLKEYPKSMKSLAEKKDWTELRALAHKFKSSVAYLGHEGFVEVLNKLEASVENNAAERDIVAWVEKTRQYSEIVLDKVVDKIEELILSR